MSENPFAYEVIPPIGRLLDIICEDRSVGGCFRPGNRWLAERMGYTSASQIPYLLSELACLGWIAYDPDTRLITLLRDYRSDQAIRSIDQFCYAEDEPLGAICSTDQRSVQQIGLAPISQTDRAIDETDAEYESDQIDRSNPQCMEDSCLAAVDHESESAAARSKIPCSAESIDRSDRSADLVMAELGTNGTLRAKALESRPDLTPQQVRDTWSHFKVSIDAGRCTDRAFFAAIARGEIHPAPPDPDRPIAVEAYASMPGFMLGSADPPEVESIRDHASRLLPDWTAENHQLRVRDWMFLQGRIGAGDSDDEALHALDAHRKAVRR